MKKTKDKFEYSFTPSKEYLRETCDLPAKVKLAWLEEANRFVREAVPEAKLARWRELQGRDINEIKKKLRDISSRSRLTEKDAKALSESAKTRYARKLKKV